MADDQKSGSAEARRGSQPPDPLLGRVVNERYRILSLLARGGMAKVYRAEQSPLGREVALKVLDPHYSGDSDPEFQKRFFLEASTCSKLSHPNTVTIFDYGRTDDDVYYIAMELLEGRTLHREIRDHGPLEPTRAMHVARQICRSLREAHALGVIHRDLKPANVFLVHHADEADHVKVLDFGLVKEVAGTGEDLTQTGLFMGSPKYMSPEQIHGDAVDARADVYALGVILFEMLTGTVPFDRPNSVNILMAHVHEPPPTFAETNPNVSVDPALERLVQKALAKAPEDRFTSMDEMLGALRQLAIDNDLSVSRSVEVPLGHTGSAASGSTASLSSFPPPAPLDPTPPPAPSPAGPRSTAPFLVAGAALVIAFGLAVVILGRGRDAPDARGAPQPPSASEHAVDEAGEEAPPEATEPTAAEPTAAESVFVTLRSEPAGAMVRVGEALYGPTPIEVEWTARDARVGDRVTFVFELDGHRDYSVTRVVRDEPLEVEAQLEAIRPVPRPERTSPRRDRPAARPTGPVEGYKLDPY